MTDSTNDHQQKSESGEKDIEKGQGASSSRERVVSITRSERSLFIGPLPPPDVLGKYNNAAPNGADRILAMAEQEGAHRREMEKAVVESDIRRADRGLILGFVVVAMFWVGGIALIVTGNSVSGLILLLGPLAALAGTFIQVQRSRKEERLRRSRTLAEQELVDEKED